MAVDAEPPPDHAAAFAANQRLSSLVDAGLAPKAAGG